MSLLPVVVGVLTVVVGLVASIALHELGHMVPAKRFGVRVSQYMVGFGRTLWSRTTGETEYGVKAIPLGGYVRLVGMYPPREGLEPQRQGFFASLVADARDASSEEVLPGEETRAFYNLSAPKKIIVMMGGPVMNLVIAAVLFFVIFSVIGLPGASMTLATVQPCVSGDGGSAASECSSGDPASPAASAGLIAGDEILGLGETEAASWKELTELIDESAGEATTIVVERDEREITLQITPAVVEHPVLTADGEQTLDDTGGAIVRTGGRIGVTAQLERQRAGLGMAGGALLEQVSATGGAIITLPRELYRAARTLFTGEERDATSVLSVVGVGQIAVDVAQSDSPMLDRFVSMLFLLAALNIALFVFNLIPLLPLDGGHVLSALFEGGRRQLARLAGRPRPGPADVAKLVPATYLAFFGMVGVGVLLIVVDLVNPVELF